MQFYFMYPSALYGKYVQIKWVNGPQGKIVLEYLISFNPFSAENGKLLPLPGVVDEPCGGGTSAEKGWSWNGCIRETGSLKGLTISGWCCGFFWTTGFVPTGFCFSPSSNDEFAKSLKNVCWVSYVPILLCIINCNLMPCVALYPS